MQVDVKETGSFCKVFLTPGQNQYFKKSKINSSVECWLPSSRNIQWGWLDNCIAAWKNIKQN